jgi:hypothetical protein
MGVSTASMLFSGHCREGRRQHFVFDCMEQIRNHLLPNREMQRRQLWAVMASTGT